MSTEPMSNEEYQDVQNKVCFFAGAILPLNLDAFLERIRVAEAVGPMEDPTLFRKAAGKLGAIKALAEGLAAFQRTARRASGDLIETRNT